MKPILFYFTALLLGLPAARLAAAPSKPNIVFILADDLGYMDIGAFNPKTFYETPNIDALAKRGMRFTQGYAACGVCSPTRGSIMTGKYPPRFGITNFIGGLRSGKLLPAPNAKQLALEEVTIAETLRDAGYATFFAGKWHLGNEGFMPRDQGFTHDEGAGTGPEGIKARRPEDPKSTDRITDAAVNFIGTHKDKPFFAYLPYNAPHVPIGARSDLVAKWEEKAKQAPPDAWGQEGANKLRMVQNHAKYAAMLEQFDSGVGRVIAALETHGLTEKTIIIFMSDNGGLATAEGWPTSNLPLRAGKGWPYEGGVREPMIVLAPGVTKPGSVCDVPVISTDFYPTLLQLTGELLKPDLHLDGVSFVPLLKGGAAPRGKALFWHYPHYANQGGAPNGVIREGDWKLIEWYEDGALELYNIPQDAGEKTDLAKMHPDKVRDLHRKLAAWRQEVGALMPVPNPTATAGPVPLFDGKSLEGWDYDPAVWRIEDGVVTGGNGRDKVRENAFICTQKSYRNFDLKLKIRCSGDPATGMINSGIQIRSLRVPGGAHMSGYQVDCGAGWFGKIYDEFRRNRVIAEPVDAAALAQVVDVFGWNDYHIRAEGPRIRTWINGVLATDYTETDPKIALEGRIAPQIHSGGAALVQFKDVTVEELPATPDVPTWESLGGVEAARNLHRPTKVRPNPTPADQPGPAKPAAPAPDQPPAKSNGGPAGS